MLRRATLCATVVVLTMIGTYAQAPEDDACYGLEDNAWGLCNAYCNAMDCDGDMTNASPVACGRVAMNYMDATGEQTMPCEEPLTQTEPQAGSCPCKFDLQFWTEQDQILPSSDLKICSGPEDPTTCLTCKVNHMPGSFTLLGVLANLFVPGSFAEEDRLFFFASEPSPLVAGMCGVDASFASGFSFTTEGDGLSVNSEEFAACAFDIGLLADAYLEMCSRFVVD